MKAKLYTLGSKEIGEAKIDKDIFAKEPRADIIQRVVNWQMAKRQSGDHKTKGISEISGTTAKPFKQKGTGNARQGSKRSAQMRGGATIFGPLTRSHAHKLPKKIRKLGLKAVLLAKYSEKKLAILKEATLKEVKTSVLLKDIANFPGGTTLIITGTEMESNFKKAANNIKGLNVLPQQGSNVYDILKYDNLFLTEDAIVALAERLK